MQKINLCYSNSWPSDWKNVLQIVQSIKGKKEKELQEKETRKKQQKKKKSKKRFFQLQGRMFV